MEWLWEGIMARHGKRNSCGSLKISDIYIYIYIYTHTHTHTHIYIYIYIEISSCVP
jgi:hypothetical protein